MVGVFLGQLADIKKHPIHSVTIPFDSTIAVEQADYHCRRDEFSMMVPQDGYKTRGISACGLASRAHQLRNLRLVFLLTAPLRRAPDILHTAERPDDKRAERFRSWNLSLSKDLENQKEATMQVSELYRQRAVECERMAAKSPK
jgi:hypothetical protein